jgi:predicted nucleic acid-binding protein
LRRGSDPTRVKAVIYLDANVLVALCVEEPASAKVDAWLARQSGTAVATSQWALTETTSAIGIKVRRKDISRQAADASLDLLEAKILPLLDVLDLPTGVFARADALLRMFDLGLRAGDALHLAICMGADDSTLATADALLLAAAKKLRQRAVKVY